MSSNKQLSDANNTTYASFFSVDESNTYNIHIGCNNAISKDAYNELFNQYILWLSVLVSAFFTMISMVVLSKILRATIKFMRYELLYKLYTPHNQLIPFVPISNTFKKPNFFIRLSFIFYGSIVSINLFLSSLIFLFSLI